MERYQEVLLELSRVEAKMESQSLSSSSSSSEGLGASAPQGTGRTRLGSSGRSTLQAIGSAAAAGSPTAATDTLQISTVYSFFYTENLKQLWKRKRLQAEVEDYFACPAQAMKCPRISVRQRKEKNQI